jgi:hypothetical protein
MNEEKPAPARDPGAASRRDERLAAALRENLKKRKEQARGRAGADKNEPGTA